MTETRSHSHVIDVNNISKKYYLKGKYHRNLSEEFGNFFKSILSRQQKKEEVFWALKNINFSLDSGDILGIIGENGAGKSTLLKILSDITAPTSGSVIFRGRVTSILEIGTGFHPDLTGRENIYLNGSILGMTISEIDDCFDDIVKFSGVKEFINSPVKHYSNGMYLRLAFSVAFHSVVDILLIDEVLSVGDAEFRINCMRQIQKLALGGTTIVVVSHNMSEILRLCTKCILMEHGEIKDTGTPIAIVSRHMKHAIEKVENAADADESINTGSPEYDILEQDWAIKDDKPGNEIVKLLNISIKPVNKSIGEPFHIRDDIIINMEYIKFLAGYNVQIALLIFNSTGNMVFPISLTFNLDKNREYDKYIEDIGRFSARCLIPGNLINSGKYAADVIISKNINEPIFTIKEAVRFTIIENPGEENLFIEEVTFPLRPSFDWKFEKLSEK
ncbi:MAG: ATP-binding cassette domain-containing protein [Candidatus Marinimicrobia bacterium]|nr:ATP-binding cassette domain-containing protein [Candidatus Neomarinimicrobiota bacterium]MBT3759908.1 ATP-binding cassette domain-containing protein [Candidatus Neomarinimicrobiota bacterium]MBT3895639.1 ATP-binding cassette domain-containing protein [Candidatus Neomarinimicrobiota bacterium]MBT4173322.1 ATP-binding cassette domain-containing protein [Candidatus Neomarinimicrobiota bacterium]MBT4537745.1 ATP-binding cassette domain-containing protein [Candidatus Neomarinimicrobiota bacterium